MIFDIIELPNETILVEAHDSFEHNAYEATVMLREMFPKQAQVPGIYSSCYGGYENSISFMK